MRKSVKRAIVVTTAIVAVAAAGIAYAAWNASGTGTASTKATNAQALSIVDGTPIAQLYPGGSSDVVLTIHNPNPYPVKVTSITGGTITASVGTCTTNGTGVTFDNQVGKAYVVAAGGDLPVTLAGAAHMSNASDDTCQGAVFTIPLTLSGASNAS
jgi:hypothetical protein